MKLLPLPLAACLFVATGVSAAQTGVRLSLNARLRYEDVQQSGLLDATAFTLRSRLGLSPEPFHGWTALLEAENIIALDGGRYSQAGLNPGGAGRAVVPDPTGTEINQAWVAFSRRGTTVTLGRQRLVLDNARFVGDSGWRQNMQTFDAVLVQDKSLEDTVLTYAWLDRINRVLGDRHAQGYWQSNSHLLNARYSGFAAGALTAYAYLLDFRPAAAPSCATYGASFAGSAPVSRALKLAYRAELATQSDYGSGALDYAATYCLLELGLTAKAGGLTLGHEVLGADHGVGFKTPLATLHAFNGWADIFAATPAAGLRDTYVKGSANLPGDLKVLVGHHWFTTERGGPAPGREFDLQVVRKFGPRLTVLFKYANFRRTAAGYPDVQKVWAQAEFAH